MDRNVIESNSVRATRDVVVSAQNWECYGPRKGFGYIAKVSSPGKCGLEDGWDTAEMLHFLGLSSYTQDSTVNLVVSLRPRQSKMDLHGNCHPLLSWCSKKCSSFFWCGPVCSADVVTSVPMLLKTVSLLCGEP